MSDPYSGFDELTRGLAAVRRRIHRASLISATANGVANASTAAIVCAAIACAALLILQLTGSAVARYAMAALGLATAGIVAGCLVRPILAAAKRTSSLAHAAERLDLGLADHNRVANAYYLASEGQDSSFARSAIADGLATLRRAGPSVAIVDGPQWRVMRPLMFFAVALGLFVLPKVITRHLESEIAKPFEVATIAGATSRSQQSDLHQIDRPPAVAAPPARESTPSRLAGASAFAPGVTASQGRSAATLSPAAAAGAGASAGTGATTAGPADPSPTKPTDSHDPSKPDARAAAKKTESESGSGGDTRGAAAGDGGENGGRGSAGTAVAADAEQKTSTPQGRTGQSGAAGEQAALADATPQQSNYNAGTSPLRQDRGGSVSRELGQSGNSGESGNGRGGPSEVKKARGAGAVFLSVPLPDYLPGKLSPGTSRTTRQQIPSQAIAILSPLPVPVAASAGGNESIINQFDVPLDQAADVARYLNALRRSDDAAVPAVRVIAPLVPAAQGVPSP